MSDVPQGSGWWQASDGRWYAPHLHPSAAPQYAAPPPSYQPAPAQSSGFSQGLGVGTGCLVAFIVALVLAVGGCGVLMAIGAASSGQVNHRTDDEPRTPVGADAVLGAALGVSSQVTDVELDGFETVWVVNTTIEKSEQGDLTGKAICEVVRELVKADRKNVTVKGEGGWRILATGTHYGRCVQW